MGFGLHVTGMAIKLPWSMLKSQRRAKGRLNRNILLMTIFAAVNCDSKGNGQLLSPSSANLYSAHGRMLRLHQHDLWYFKLFMMITH